MNTNLLPLLDHLLPKIVAWAQEQETQILHDGIALSDAEREIAAQIGVRFPERVRLLRVSKIPQPRDLEVREAARNADLLSASTAGMALRYGVLIRDDVWGNRIEIAAHELAHTAQYERLGGFEPFLKQYLGECLTVGYENSPLEREAIEVAARLFR